MNFVTGIAAVAALSIASAFAESPRTDERQVIALADAPAAHIATADVSLDGYAGCYALDDDAFVITRDEDHLTLEAPESWGLDSLILRALDTETFVTLDGTVRVEFVRDPHGSVVGAALFHGGSRTVTGARSTSRGIVTLEDPASPTFAFPRTIVTIYDVPTNPDSVGAVTAAN
jgi:hypothetical protein